MKKLKVVPVILGLLFVVGILAFSAFLNVLVLKYMWI